MSERKMHYFEFHFQKIIAATKGWKDDEFGAFVKLLIEQFDRGHVPEDPEEIGLLITTYKKNWPRLSKKFTAPSEPGQLRNAFMITIRNAAHEKSAINAANGKKGAEQKKRKKSERLSDGLANAERTDKRTASQPVTSNQEPVISIDTPEEGESVNTLADLSSSNLFRKPSIPDLETVKRVFAQQGGTAEMAQKFFENNTAVGWFYKGSPITSFSNLVPGYIANWTKNEKNSAPHQKANGTTVADAIAIARAAKTNAQ